MQGCDWIGTDDTFARASHHLDAAYDVESVRVNAFCYGRTVHVSVTMSRDERPNHSRLHLVKALRSFSKTITIVDIH